MSNRDQVERPTTCRGGFAFAHIKQKAKVELLIHTGLKRVLGFLIFFYWKVV